MIVHDFYVSILHQYLSQLVAVMIGATQLSHELRRGVRVNGLQLRPR